MAKFKQEYAVDGDWSRWVYPVMKGYKMACCDCGLVHELEFRIAECGERVEFRAKRNNRSTAQLRRHQGITFKQFNKLKQDARVQLLAKALQDMVQHVKANFHDTESCWVKQARTALAEAGLEKEGE